MRKSPMAALGAAAAATVVLGTALPASANTRYVNNHGCTVSLYNTVAANDASSYDPDGGCGQLRVRHRYTSGGYQQWTGWYGGSAINVATPCTPYLSKSEHEYGVLGGLVTYSRTGS
jgi:hypothetical protein